MYTLVNCNILQLEARISEDVVAVRVCLANQLPLSDSPQVAELAQST